MDASAVIVELGERADPSRKPGMARVGIDVSQALGVSMPDIRAIAKTCGVDHALALELWETEIHEARILATLVADPDALTETQTGEMGPRHHFVGSVRLRSGRLRSELPARCGRDPRLGPNDRKGS